MRYAIIIIFCYTQALSAQPDLRITNIYTTQNGLSDNIIYCIRQDSRGFLWLGTQEGLNRFDGYRFKNFFADKKNGLASNTITDILEYKKGQLIIGTSNGLSVLNTFSSNFENEKIKFPQVATGSGTLINSLYKDRKGNIWVNHSGELDILDSNLHYLYRFTNLPWAKDLKGVKIQWEDWFTDKQDRIWLPTDRSGIQIIDLSQKKIWNSHNNPQHFEFLDPQFIRSAFLDESANVLWYAPWGLGVFRYDLTTHKQEQQNFGSAAVGELHSVNSITKIDNGKILCSRGLELYAVDTVTMQYQKVPIEIPGLNDKYIETAAVFNCNNGNYWMGSYYGLLKMGKEESVATKFNTIIGKEKLTGDCTDMSITSFGKIYCSFYNNMLIEIGDETNEHHIYSIPGKKDLALTQVKEYKKEQLWIGTMSGLYLFNTLTKTFEQPKHLHPDLYKARINFIYSDKDSTIWITTRDPFGIYKYEPLTGACEKIKNSVTDHFETLGEGSRISCIAEDDKKKLWMVSRLGGGIICYNKNTDDWSIYPNQNKHPSLLTKGLAYVYADPNNNLWFFDEYGSGVMQYNYITDSLNYITRNDGLPGDMVRSVTTDDRRNLWVLTDHGISKFDLQKRKILFTHFFQSKLVNPEKLVKLAYDPTSNSFAYVAGDDIFVLPGNELFSQKKESLQPIIDKVWVNNKEVNIDVNTQHVKLKPGQRNVSIDFTVVHYSNADKIKFAYQLSGADQDWKYADVNRSAQYAVLTPGTYTFKIKVADENGNWTRSFDSFSFTIVPYFWQTTWFKVSAVLLLVAGCWLLVRRRIKNIRHEAELKQKIAETEMMALRAQMNPHFIFNCINSIDAMIQSNDKYHATVYLNKFAKLIRNILDSSKQNLVPLSKDIETLQLYIDLEMFRNENKFKAEINTDPQLLNDDYQVPPLIIQPYVENAILHGLRNRDDDNGTLTVNIQKQNGYLKYEIIDNGVGRNKKQAFSDLKRSNGYGMQMSEDRVRIFNKEEKASVYITDLKYDDQPIGTKVTVQLNIQ